jgi:hypothetical protein
MSVVLRMLGLTRGEPASGRTNPDVKLTRDRMVR